MQTLQARGAERMESTVHLPIPKLPLKGEIHMWTQVSYGLRNTGEWTAPSRGSLGMFSQQSEKWFNLCY